MIEDIEGLKKFAQSAVSRGKQEQQKYCLHIRAINKYMYKQSILLLHVH